jgi:hypothetical protein
LTQRKQLLIVYKGAATRAARKGFAVRKRKKRANPDTCGCTAYPFPHKVGGGRCKRRKPVRLTKEVKRRIDKRVRRARREGRYTPNR